MHVPQSMSIGSRKQDSRLSHLDGGPRASGASPRGYWLLWLNLNYSSIHLVHRKKPRVGKGRMPSRRQMGGLCCLPCGMGDLYSLPLASEQMSTKRQWVAHLWTTRLLSYSGPDVNLLTRQSYQGHCFQCAACAYEAQRRKRTEEGIPAWGSTSGEHWEVDFTEIKFTVLG